jgi:thioredoxin-related protein
MNNFIYKIYMEYHELFIIIFLIIMFFVYIQNKDNDLKYVKSSFDNREYLVRDKEDNINAANLLASISSKMTMLCHYMQKKYRNNKDVQRLIEKFDPTSIVELEKDNNNTSYTINKGEKIVLCLRSKDDNENLQDENTLMFVALHELSHIMTIMLNHPTEFWKNFKFILENAIELKIYRYVNYNKEPQPYCGITITDTPLNDKNL